MLWDIKIAIILPFLENMEDLHAMSSCNETIFLEQDRQFLEPSSMLLLTLVGKTFLNLFIFGSERKNVSPSFMGYFNISVAFADFMLLLTISFLSYFQDVALWGARFTKYHICLFTQIVSFTYGLMHYPVFFVAGLDYLLSITGDSKHASIRRRLLCVTAVLILWIITLYYVLTNSDIYSSLAISSYFFSYQCPFYVSIQSHRLSAAILFIITCVLIICWYEVVALLRSFRMVSYGDENVMLFSFAASCHQPTQCKKKLLASFLVCFLGTWLPFGILQMIIVLLNAQIPAYMDMNVPWLYFLNSFLIGAVHCLKQYDLELVDVFATDPFVSWKFTFTPFVIKEHLKDNNMRFEKSVTITVV